MPNSGYITPTQRQLDRHFTQYVGFDETAFNRSQYDVLFAPGTLQLIQRKVQELLQGVADRPILVTPDVIGNVLSSVIETHKPQVGSIYSRYIQAEQPVRNDVQEIINRTIEIITSTIRNEYEMIENNKRLSVWNALLGDFNHLGLRSHAPIKLRKKRTQQMMFNMNY
jgi:hypothetical protein